jgi:exodeoxyribonuclease X
MSRITESLFSIVDVETTGLDPKTARVIEVAMKVVSPFQGWRATWSLEAFVDPGVPIPADISGITHIVDEDVCGKWELEQIAPALVQATAGTIVVAHNSSFDLAFLPMLACRRSICSKRLAQHIVPDAPNHKNQTLRYFLGHGKVVEGAGHRAGDDVTVTAKIFETLVERYLAAGGEDDVDALIALSESPTFVQRMYMGKHAGQPMRSLDDGMLRWILQKLDDVEHRDLRYTARTILRERAEGHTSRVSA